MDESISFSSTRYVNYKKNYYKNFFAYMKISNPLENLKEKIEKIIELELLENKINKINRINRIYKIKIK